LEVLQWLRNQDPPCPWNEHTCTAAAANGNLDVLQWLRSSQLFHVRGTKMLVVLPHRMVI
jgi:hypothetical protein